jgi:hypothetical protein
MYLARVSKPGYNANQTDTANLFFYETYPSVKILKQVGITGNTERYNPGLGNKVFGVFAFEDSNNELFHHDTYNLSKSRFFNNFSFSIVFNQAYDRELELGLTTNQKKLIFYTIESNFQSNEDFKFVINDETGIQKILSSEFDHLKEYQSGLVNLTVSMDRTIRPESEFIWETSSTSVSHNLGYRPLCLAYGKLTSFYSSHPYLFVDTNITFFHLPKVFLAVFRFGWPKLAQRTIFYGIKNNVINFYAGISAYVGYLNPGDRLIATANYEIYYKIFYNDIDETFSYV